MERDDPEEDPVGDTASLRPSEGGSPRRSWKTRFIALGFGITLLGVGELGLRIFGVAESEHWTPPRLVTIVQDGAIRGEWQISQSAHFVPSSMVDGQAGFRTSEDHRMGKGDGYPAGGCMRDERFTQAPAAGNHRYFLLGGSAAMGQNASRGPRKSWLRVRKTWPVETMPNGVSVLPDDLAISGQLEKILKESGHPAEVINAGMIAQDSGAVRAIAKEVLDFNPTGLILYLGNNEGIGLSLAMNGLEVPTDWPAVKGALHRIRLYRVLADRILPAQQRSAAQKTISLRGTQPEVLGRLTLAQWSSAGSPLIRRQTPTDEVYQAIMARFESNLRAIVQEAHSRGVQVYIIPTPTHLTSPPFYKTGPGRSWPNDPRLSKEERKQHTKIKDQAKQAIDSEDWASALELSKEAIAIDAFNADGHYYRGWALHNLDRGEEALEALLEAYALDVSRKRTHPAFAEIAEQVCADLGCRTTSAHDSILEKVEDEGLTVYDRLLGDHEHLYPSGSTWIASLFANLILEED